MPTYTVKNKEGVTLKVTGESPPTKEQLDNIFTEYNQRQIQTSPVAETLPDQIKLTEESIKQDPEWIKASKSVYKWNEGEDAPDLDSDKEYADYGLSYMGRFNYNLPQMTVEATQLKNASDQQKKDFITLMDMYDKKAISWSGAGRAFTGIATDPTTYIGLGTFGAGTVGAQAVKQAIKEGVKEATKAGLKQGSKIGAIEGSIYATADNALRQTARINAGDQEEFDLGESAKAAAFGSVVGGGLGGTIGGIGTNIASRKLNQTATRESSVAQKENITTEEIKKDVEPIVGKEITGEAEQTSQPLAREESLIKERLEDIEQPIEDVDLLSTEIASGLLGKNYQKIATQVIDSIKKPLIRYSPLGSLPDYLRYLGLRGLATGKLEKIRNVTRDVYDTFSQLTPEQNETVRKYLIKDAPLETIQDPIIRSQAKDLRDSIDFIGDSLVKAKILSEDVVNKNKESYLPRMYLKYLDKKGRMDYTKSRKELDDATKEFLGEVKDVSLQGPKAIEDPMTDIVRYSLFEKISEDPKWTVQSGLIDFQGKKVSPVWLNEEKIRINEEIVKGLRPKEDKKLVDSLDNLIDQANLNLKKEDLSLYKQVPPTKPYGALKGSYIRKEIYDDLMSAGDFVKPKDNWAKSVLGDEGAVTQATKLWKMSKVALNPPTQVRNLISNVILLNLSGVSWRKLPTRLMQALDDMRKNGPYTEIANKYGIINSTFSKQEMIDINRAYLRAKAKQTGNPIDRVKYIAGATADIASNAYQKMEVLGKTAKIIDEMSKGANEATAALRAQETLFDYSLVPPSVRYLRNAPVGIPFITYYYKVLPNLLETAIRYPERYIPFIALPYGMHEILKNYQNITQEDVEIVKNSMPEWIRDNGNAVILPVKDENDKWQVFDFSYFLPYSMFTGIVKDAAQGEIRDVLSASGVFGGPLPQIVSAIQTNIDPFTQREIINEFDPPSKQIADLIFYGLRMAAPTWLTDIGFAGKLLQSINKDVNKYGDPKITKTQAITRLFGVNIYPIDPAKSRADNIKFMRNEISRIKARRTQALRDKNLTTEERKKLTNQYLEMLQDRQKQLKDYIKESKLSKTLK
tara:strand:- start:45 stop:3299 length:3255 start_codon:yes stop_codon:yes gene_type:complete